MPFELFNPFARYVIVKEKTYTYAGEYGYAESLQLVTPVHYTDALEDAERTVQRLNSVTDANYAVRENAAWKALDKRRYTLKATAYGDAGGSPGIDIQLGIAAEALHDMLIPPAYPEETECERCRQKTAGPDKMLCPDCERYAESFGRKCVCCGNTGCVPGINLCRLCKTAETMAQRDRERHQPQQFRRTVGTALERTDAPDSPTAKPEGSAVWAKTDK